MPKTDPEKSPYFHKWEYRGNALQKRLKVGPKAALFAPSIPEKHIIKALEEEDGDALLSLKMAFDAGSQVWSGSKTVKPTRWWIEFAEGKEDGYDVLYKQSAWAYRCVEIRSQALAQVPWQIVRGEEIVEEGPLVDLLEDVNPESNWGELIAATEADLCIFGSAYWLKVRQGTTPMFVQRLNPKMVKVDKNEAGIRAFLYGDTQVPYKREDVVYFHTYNPDDELIGLSPLEICRTAIQVESSANDHMADFFENHAMPQYIFSAETNDQNELQRLAAAWHKQYGSKGKQFKTAFVGGKAEPKELGYAPSDLALKDVREEARKSICGALGVPPVLAGAWEAANYATAKEQRQGLYTETTIPRAEYIASVINAELAAELGEDEFEWEFEGLTALQEDETSKATRLALLVEKNILKPEVAAEELGYDAADVPEPAPVPEALQAFVGTNEANRNPPPTAEQEQEEELAKWRKKAMRRLRDGKSPAAVFQSDVIDRATSDYILGALETCKTAKDIGSVFDKAKTWRGYP